MKKQSQKLQESDQSEKLPDFLTVESRVFTQTSTGIIYIGRDKIDSTLRSVLRDEAKYIKESRLWEILNASVINEAYNLALVQSKDFDHVQFAKAMKHWSFFIMNIIEILDKKE